MSPVPSFDLLMSHRDQVTRLPEGAEVVATATYCPVGAYRIGDHVFCVQGHPEWVPELSRILMGKRREVIGDEVVDAALESLQEPPDSEAVVAWVAEFFRRQG
jgi:GMP synthase-like glutamine amidotransferase